MKKFTCILFLVLSYGAFRAQSVDSLKVYYYDNFPYAYTEAGKLKGIEVEIIEAYVSWLNARGEKVAVSYTPFREFSAFYKAVKGGNTKVIGLGSVTSTSEREKEVSFSAPYLQNVAVLITAGKVPTIRTKTAAEVSKTLGSLNAIGVNGSSHIGYLNDIKKSYLPSLKIETTETQQKVLEKIVADNNTFGYVDIIAYWAFLKANPSKFLKIQKEFNEPKEYLGFILPLNSSYKNSVNEFFESGFGFTSTKAYHQILEKYLGYEILESVEIK